MEKRDKESFGTDNWQHCPPYTNRADRQHFSAHRHQVLDDVHVRKGVDLDRLAEIRVDMAKEGRRVEEKFLAEGAVITTRHT